MAQGVVPSLVDIMGNQKLRNNLPKLTAGKRASSESFVSRHHTPHCWVEWPCTVQTLPGSVVLAAPPICSLSCGPQGISQGCFSPLNTPSPLCLAESDLSLHSLAAPFGLCSIYTQLRLYICAMVFLYKNVMSVTPLSANPTWSKHHFFLSSMLVHDQVLRKDLGEINPKLCSFFTCVFLNNV